MMASSSFFVWGLISVVWFAWNVVKFRVSVVKSGRNVVRFRVNVVCFTETVVYSRGGIGRRRYLTGIVE